MLPLASTGDGLRGHEIKMTSKEQTLLASPAFTVSVLYEPQTMYVRRPQNNNKSLLPAVEIRQRGTLVLSRSTFYVRN